MRCIVLPKLASQDVKLSSAFGKRCSGDAQVGSGIETMLILYSEA